MNPKLSLIPLAFFILCQLRATRLQAQDNQQTLWAVAVGPEYTGIGGDYDSLFLWSNQIPKANLTLKVPGTITNLAWHPDGTHLVISTQWGSKEKGKGVMALEISTMAFQVLKSVSETGARAIGWSPAGDLLAVGDNEGLLMIYDQNFDLVKKVDTGLRSITGLSWHPTKRVVTFVSGKIGNYDLDSEALQVWESRPEEILLLSVDWHPSDKFFALGDYGDYSEKHPPLLQFHRPDGSLIKALMGSKAEYRNIQWTADGQYLATASDAFRLWGKDGELISSLPFEHLLWGLSFDKQHQQWIVTDEIGQVYRVSADGKEVLGSMAPFVRAE